MDEDDNLFLTMKLSVNDISNNLDFFDSITKLAGRKSTKRLVGQSDSDSDDQDFD